MDMNQDSDANVTLDEVESDYPGFEGDTSDFDYVQYMPGDSIEQVQKTWPQDPAFIPTSTTYSLAFIIGKRTSALFSSSHIHTASARFTFRQLDLTQRTQTKRVAKKCDITRLKQDKKTV